MRSGIIGMILGCLICVPAAATALTAVAVPPRVQPQPEHARILDAVEKLAEKHRVRGGVPNNAGVATLFDRYLLSLDPGKSYFSKQDADSFVSTLTRPDGTIDVTVAFAMHDLFEQRVTERVTLANSLLTAVPDFTLKEVYDPAPARTQWAQSDQQMREKWRKKIKHEWLNLRLVGTSDKAIAEILAARYLRLLKMSRETNSDAVFQALMDAFSQSIDLHTGWFGSQAIKEFSQSSTVGVGLKLKMIDGYPTLLELSPGGPAAMSGKLHRGDRIVGIATNESDTMIDAAGLRLQKINALLRGSVDSTVVLYIRANGASETAPATIVPLTRKTESQGHSAATSTVVELTKSDTTRRIGVIKLPTFYFDFESSRLAKSEHKSSTNDVVALLAKLKQQNIDRVLLDLRGNTGGAYMEAIALAGLFIPQGPVAQQRSHDDKIEIEKSENDARGWNGQVSVLLDQNSAGATEIFAAAIQDYGRGLIIGEPSFGMGTIHRVFDPTPRDQLGKVNFGMLKLLIGQWYRVTGNSIQRRGVTPDIVFAPGLSDETIGENNTDNALPWTQIKAVNFRPLADQRDLIARLTTEHQARIRNDPDFQAMLNQKREARVRRTNTSVSLNETERRALNASTPRAIENDVYLTEALNIIGDASAGKN